MKSINKLRKRKGVSPVIATVILVAVAITVAVAVAYWMTGIAGQYTAFEKIEIQSAYAEIQPLGGWIITLEMKNTGSATANLITVFINDRPVDIYSTATTVNTFTLTEATLPAGESTGTNILDTGEAIESGKTAEVGTALDPVEVYIGSTLFSSGTTMNIKIHSAAGMDYIRLIQLP